MHDYDKMDSQLAHALAPHEVPPVELKQRTKNAIRAHAGAKTRTRPLFRAALVAVISFALLTATGYAAWMLLSPGEVASRLSYPALAKAFEGPDALVLNESATYGEYTATLLGIASGQGLGLLGNEAIEPEKTYAVVAIASDTNPGLATMDVSFFVSPLVKGIPPWQLNAASMHGGYIAQVFDGILYRIVECDSIEIFADKGLYMCVSETAFFSTDAYTYDALTGEITRNPSFDGMNALFDLPLDPAKGDPCKAEEYLRTLWEQDTDAELDPESLNAAMLLENFDPDSAELLVDSIMVLETDEKGYYQYSYRGGLHSVLAESLFVPEEYGFAHERSMSESDMETLVTLFHKDVDGIVTGRTYRLPQ